VEHIKANSVENTLEFQDITKLCTRALRNAEKKLSKLKDTDVEHSEAPFQYSPEAAGSILDVHSPGEVPSKPTEKPEKVPQISTIKGSISNRGSL